MKKKAQLTGGVKFDAGKIPLELLSATWIEGVGSVLAFGATKYAAHNWRKGISQSRLVGAGLRHTFRYLAGEDLDPETGLSHLLHASCCFMFAFELKQTHPQLDDRYIIRKLLNGQDLRNRKKKRKTVRARKTKHKKAA